MAHAGRKWLYLIEQFTKMFDVFSSSAAPAAVASQHEVAKLNVVLQKALRAKAVLEQLQLLEHKEAALRSKYQTLLEVLPQAQQQLPPETLHRAAEFALEEGMRGAILSATGRAPPPNAAAQDPFGIRVALSQSHPGAMMTWRTYLAHLDNLANHAVADEASTEEAVEFNQERRLLLREMQSLQQSLEGEVELPNLRPLQEDVESLDRFVQAVLLAKRAHVEMLRRDINKLDLPSLELRLQIAMGEGYASSAAAVAVQELRPLHDSIRAGKLPSTAQVAQLEAGIRELGRILKKEKGLVQQQASAQSQQKALFDSCIRQSQAKGV